MTQKEKVKELFDDIAPTYDKLNHLLSFNIDKIWRRKAIGQLDREKVKIMLDVACGTGDFSIMAGKKGIPMIYGIDISDNMLDIGNQKIAALGMQDKIRLQQGDSEHICFENETFDAVTVAFGVRNFEQLDKGLKEMNRVLKKDGKVIILEFSMPCSFPMKQLYSFYFKYILPVIGGLISKNKQAYQYLPDSVTKFPQGNKFLQIMQECGFRDVTYKELTLGVANIYTGIK